MHRRKVRITILGSLLAGVLALGATAPQTAWAGGTGRCGGTDGPKKQTLTCPSGQYVVGLMARGGVYVDLVGIACAPIGADGKRGPVGAFMTAGPGGGTTTKSGICDGNRAVLHIYGKSGSYYDRMYLGHCDLRDVSTGRFVDGGGRSLHIDIGGPGGISCKLSCPSGEALYSVTVKYGSWIDSISGQCRP